MYGNVPFLYRLHQRYGNTYQVRSWISLPTVCTIATENLRTINTSKDFGVEPTRLPGLAYFCGRVFITTDGNTWNHSRKLLKPSFDSSNIRDLTTLSREVDHLIEELPKDTSAVDLQAPLYARKVSKFSLAFRAGVHPSEGSSGAPLTADEFVRAFHDALFYSMVRVVLGRAWSLLPQSRYIKSCAKAHGFVDYYISQAYGKEDPPKSKSLIQVLSAQTNDPEFIRNQVIQAMIAAQDTTSELLTNALFLLARHPKYWQQLRSEFVDRSEGDLSVESLRGSKSIENALHETLRLHPIFPLLGRVALRDTKLPVGGGPHHDRPMFTPKGSPVVMGYYALYRNPEVFGEDLEAFRPEHWNSIKPAQWDFLGFGGSNRACLGQQKTMLEASYVLARLSQAIEKLTSADDREWKGELKLTCKSANGCKFKYALSNFQLVKTFIHVKISGQSAPSCKWKETFFD
ncbi:putative Cytochrome P450 [Seiridium unicorne]|uniref:Cytochrome P450 n=1 Tax=Seiridium unicorne TaxID=138068 RepID=A0ABR2UK61_9PEZI